VHANRGINADEAEPKLEYRYDDYAAADTEQPGQHAGNRSGHKHDNTEYEPLFHDSSSQSPRRSP
jgi:hypothetical protein